jgi:two-component system cell cycle sensor histidine kinase/response regulator CckA
MERPAIERLAALVEYSTDVLMLVRADGIVEWASPAARDVLGYDASELSGSDSSRLVTGDELPAWRARFDEMLKHPGVPTAHRFRSQGADGRVRWISCVGRNLLSDPRVGALVFSLREAPTLPELSAPPLVRDVEAKYKSLIDQAIFAVFIVRDERLVYANQKAAEMTGFALDELLAMPTAFDIVAESDREYVREQFASLVPGGPAVQFVVRGRHKQGSPILAEVAAIISEYDGAQCIVSTVIDISDRLRLEEQLRQAQKMEAIGRLAGGIAHDFNNLLTAIRGNAELLQVRVRRDATLSSEVASIVQAADRAALLTHQLLAFSRQQNVVPVTVRLNDLVDSVTRMTRRLFGPNIELQVRRQRKLHPIVADPGQLGQVLLNLILNARDALPTGGHIYVRTANVEIAEGSPDQAATGLPPGPYVLLQVRDDGVGMDKPTQARIFEPFFTTKEPGRGTGLGLASVYGAVRQMGGAVVVESEPNRGAVFSVYIPASSEDAASPDRHFQISREE